jgi:hypothetical protein
MRATGLALGKTVLLGCIFGGCNGFLNDATRPSVDGWCADALAHVRACDARFPDRIELCSYSSMGDCPPYINGEQVQCLRRSTCDAVRTALDTGDWLCGVSLHPPYLNRL